MLWMQDLSRSRFRRLVWTTVLKGDCQGDVCSSSTFGFDSPKFAFLLSTGCSFNETVKLPLFELLLLIRGLTNFLLNSNNGSFLFTFTLSHTIIPWRHALNSRDCRRSRPYFTDFKFDCTSTSDNRILFITDRWGHTYIWFASMFSCRIG